MPGQCGKAADSTELVLEVAEHDFRVARSVWWCVFFQQSPVVQVNKWPRQTTDFKVHVQSLSGRWNRRMREQWS